MKILLTISYNGKNYIGWQKQKSGKSIQGEIEKVLELLFDEKIELFASGRTDAGVHSLGQTAHFETNNKKKFTLKKLVIALNANLPQDIKILSAKKVDNNFHARFDVKEKTYLYRLSWESNPFTNGFVGIFKNKPDINLMQKGASFLIGEHDFSSFCCSKTEVKDFVRTIYKIKISKQKNEINFEISGNGFLYNMVRIIVGTLYDVGINKKEPDEIKKILQSKNRTNAGKTAPAEGLYLKKVRY